MAIALGVFIGLAIGLMIGHLSGLAEAEVFLEDVLKKTGKLVIDED